jgi:uroporphyrinogen-III decarboxylase
MPVPQAVMVFDSWGGVLADGNFPNRSAWAYTRRVLDQLQTEKKRPAHPEHRVHQGWRPLAE